eukprot:gene10008-6987_t
MLQLFTDKANHNALKVLLAATHLAVPIDVSFSSACTNPYLVSAACSSSSTHVYATSEMLRCILYAKAQQGSLKVEDDSDGAFFSMDEEELLDFEATELSWAFTALYKERLFTPQLSETLEKLEKQLSGTRHRAIFETTSSATPTKYRVITAFCVQSALFGALTPALCHGGLMEAQHREKFPQLVKWYESFLKVHEELMDNCFELLAVQEVADFIRVPRSFEMSPVQEKFYATTPIYYVNAAPHIGHVYSTLIVDVLGRYHRVKGERTFVTTGTDEHGQKVAEAAKNKGVATYQFCTDVANEFQTCFEQMDLKTDMFTRTTNKHHYDVVKSIWEKLEKKGDIYLGKYEGWYSVSDESFLTAQNVTDGVDKENYFFRKTASCNYIFPPSRRDSDGGEGSQRLSVLNWAIPVPGNDAHCIYVWLDALFGYFSNASVEKKPDGSYEVVGYEKAGFFLHVHYTENPTGSSPVPGRDVIRTVERSSVLSCGFYAGTTTDLRLMRPNFSNACCRRRKRTLQRMATKALIFCLSYPFIIVYILSSLSLHLSISISIYIYIYHIYNLNLFPDTVVAQREQKQNKETTKEEAHRVQLRERETNTTGGNQSANTFNPIEVVESEVNESERKEQLFPSLEDVEKGRSSEGGATYWTEYPPSPVCWIFYFVFLSLFVFCSFSLVGFFSLPVLIISGAHNSNPLDHHPYSLSSDYFFCAQSNTPELTVPTVLLLILSL